MRHFTFLVGFLIAICLASIHAEEVEEKKADPIHTNIILVGATGDLAKKYLWKSLFDLFSLHYKKGVHQFRIYGGATQPQDKGRTLISQIMLSFLTCHDEKCRQKKKDFVEAVQYVQLKTEKNYQKLADLIAENTLSIYGNLANQVTYEQGRLVYLSIPPSAYKKTSMYVDKYLRPELGRPWFRVVYEKPFGHDRASAQSLAEAIGSHFKEDEIYRVDHYLGKDIVKLILPFRYVNRDHYEKLWNRNHIDRIEIVMKETLDVHDRTLFYEEVGVIRDVMQNHLTELLALVTMELPENSGNITEILLEKERLLKQVVPPSLDSVVIGQYESYFAEAIAERQRDNFTTNVPTFAAACLHVNSGKWQGIPVVMMSGKKLDEKASYVRVVFKSHKFCLDADVKVCNPQQQIIFHIGSGEPLKPPMILVSKSLPKPKDFPGWRFEEVSKDMTIYGEDINNMYQLMASSEEDAYSTLVKGVYEGQRHLFTTTSTLLKAWDIWTPVLKELHKKPLRYYEGSYVDPQALDFHVSGYSLEYVTDIPSLRHEQFTDEQMKMAQVPADFLGERLVSSSSQETLKQLASHIERAARNAIKERGVFHLAVSGGNSPKKLFHLMATQHLLFPWQHTHIWQVDERCVSHSDSASNFAMLDSHLVQHIGIPHSNVHPMPVHMYTEPCGADDSGHVLYEHQLKRHLESAGGALDFILLGVGTDGHTASLFPNQSSLSHNSSNDPWVIYSQASETYAIKHRMTLTLPVLNSARQVAVLVQGKSKHKLLLSLEDEAAEVATLPILAVRPKAGVMTWYIDHLALFGK